MSEEVEAPSHRESLGPKIAVKAYLMYQGNTLAWIAKKVGAKGADEDTMKEILEMPNSKSGKKLQTGNKYFFFGASDGVNVPYIAWYRGAFRQYSLPLETSAWGEYHRAVLDD